MWPDAEYIDPKDVEGRLSGGQGWKRYQTPNTDPEAVSVVEAPLGSIVVFDETCFMGRREYHENVVRKSIIGGYCLGWLRGEGESTAYVAARSSSKFSPELQKLIGYSIEGGLLGGIQLGEDPISLLQTS